jgi:hypothetical protein
MAPGVYSSAEKRPSVSTDIRGHPVVLKKFRPGAAMQGEQEQKLNPAGWTLNGPDTRDTRVEVGPLGAVRFTTIQQALEAV